MRPSHADAPLPPKFIAAGEQPVPRRVKDFIDISEYTSLDDLIRYLETIRDNLPPEHRRSSRSAATRCSGGG